MDQKNVLLNALMITLSVSLVVVGLEVSLATGLLSQDTATYQNGGLDRQVQICQGERVGQFHPVYGNTKEPNVRYLQKASERDDWHLRSYNEEGFRDTYDSGKDGTILVLGDSFIDGLLVGDNSTYPYLLDRWTPNETVKNYAMDGYGTDQQFRVYENISSRYDHDVVVLGYYLGNDARDNVVWRPSDPGYVVSDGELRLVHTPTNTTNGTTTYAYDYMSTSQTAGSNTATRHQSSPVGRVSRFLDAHASSYTFLRNRVTNVLISAGVITPQPISERKLSVQLSITRKLVEEISREAEREGATVLILPIPTRGEINPENPAFFRSAAIGQPYWDAQRTMLRNVSESRPNVRILNPKPMLQAAADNGTRLYGPVDPHLNDRGTRLIARLSYDWLVTNKYVRSQPGANLSNEFGQSRKTCP